MPFKTAVILQHRHCELHRDDRGRLHNEKGSAILYRDGFGVWAIHGVRVPKWLVETPREDLPVEKFAKIENAEVRREFVRKIGMERLYKNFNAKTLDRQGDYRLLVFDLRGRTGKWPYLRMKNPSTGEIHVEPVAKECKTVIQALNWRNQSDESPAILT